MAAVLSIAFTAGAATNQPPVIAPSATTFQMRMVTDATAGDCDCDEMVVVQNKDSAAQKESLHVLHKVLFDATDLKSAQLETDRLGHPQIKIIFNANAAKRFAEVTRNSVGKQLAIIIGGQLYSAPTIRSEIPGGNAVINGGFTQAEAKELVTKLNASLKK